MGAGERGVTEIFTISGEERRGRERGRHCGFGRDAILFSMINKDTSNSDIDKTPLGALKIS